MGSLSLCDVGGHRRRGLVVNALGFGPKRPSPGAIIAGSSNNAGIDGGNNFLSPFGSSDTQTTDIRRSELIMPRAGTISTLEVRLVDATGVGESVVVTLLLNGATSGITVTIPQSQAIGTLVADVIHTAAIAVGDRLTLRMVPATFAGRIAWGFRFD